MLKRLVSIVMCGLLLISCTSNVSKASNNIVKIPYKEWRIGGMYPDYFPAKVFGGAVITQSNQLSGLRIAIGPSKGDNPAQWHIYLGRPDALYVNSDLPQSLHVCWVSFVDQTFYSTDIEVPLAIRKKMIIPHKYIAESTGEEVIRYNNAIILGFGPGGNVIAWLAGVVGDPWTEFARVQSTNLGVNSEVCPNPYPDGKIPEISAKAKQWLKKHGMPTYWQEKSE